MRNRAHRLAAQNRQNIASVIELDKSEELKSEFKSSLHQKIKNDFYKSQLNLVNIVAYTSISPHHKNIENQIISLESWHKLGIQVYSINNPIEIEILKSAYPSWVKFIASKKTTNHIFGKPCVIINEMMDHFSNNNTGDVLMLINSDIILNTTEKTLNKIKSISELCIPIAHRNDYSEDMQKSKKYIFGFDVFFIHKKHVNIFPPSLYSMGQTWWDYWIPFIAMKNKLNIFLIEETIALHKEHDIQYNEKDWRKMTDYFRWENGIESNDHQVVNDSTRAHIISNSISFTI